MNQVHGTGVAVVDGPQDGAGAGHRRAGDRDARAGRSACWSPTACRCCWPTRRRGGRRGARRPGGRAPGVVPRPLWRRWPRLGRPAGTSTALLGPAVCGACYEVPAAMQAEVAAVAPAAAVRTRQGTPGLDLRAGHRREAARAPASRQVVHDPRCTVEDPGLFSHRRDGVTGRQAGVVWLGWTGPSIAGLAGSAVSDDRGPRRSREPARGAGRGSPRRPGGRPRPGRGHG